MIWRRLMPLTQKFHVINSAVVLEAARTSCRTATGMASGKCSKILTREFQQITAIVHQLSAVKIYDSGTYFQLMLPWIAHYAMRLPWLAKNPKLFRKNATQRAIARKEQGSTHKDLFYHLVSTLSTPSLIVTPQDLSFGSMR
jgi:hypothetical protein